MILHSTGFPKTGFPKTFNFYINVKRHFLHIVNYDENTRICSKKKHTQLNFLKGQTVVLATVAVPALDSSA